MKKYLAMLLALVMVLALTACGETAAPQKQEDSAPAQEQTAPAQESSGETAAPAGSRMEVFVAKYIASGEGYTMVFKMDGNETTAAYKGDNMYMTFEAEGTKAILIKNGDALYLLMPDEKMGIKMDAAPEGMEDISEEMDAQGDYTTGEMEMDGKSYYYEEYTDADGTARYLFDGDMLRYIVATSGSETTQLEIVSVEKGADDSLFTVPDGYNIMG